MTSMLDAICRDRPHLLTPKPMCSHCGVRRAKVGVLCCTCDEDPEERAAFTAKQEALDALPSEDEQDEVRPCRWGGCNGTGPKGSYCGRCGSPVA